MRTASQTLPPHDLSLPADKRAVWPHLGHTSPPHQKWERELDTYLSWEDWEQIFTHIHKGSLNVSTQENGLKIYSRWYRTPDRIHKFHPSIPPLCWRCESAQGILLHIWWGCPRIWPFWKEVHRLISHITTYTPDFTPAQYLLHHTSLLQFAYKWSLTLHLINTAKLCIPMHWRDSPPPTFLNDCKGLG